MEIEIEKKLSEIKHYWQTCQLTDGWTLSPITFTPTTFTPGL